MKENLQSILNAIKSDPPAELSGSAFEEGFIVTVTSKTTGKALTRWCKDDEDAEVFVETISDLLDSEGHCFWSMISVKELQAVCAENYYNAQK